MNSSYSITSKFQVTIPKEIREDLKLTDKNRVRFEKRGKDVVIRKVPTLEELAEEMHADLVKRGIKPATEEDIKTARYNFYRKGMKWE